MKVLIVGGGGREHALAWKMAQSDQVNQVFVAPGNAGTEDENKVTNISLSATDIEGLIQFAKDIKIDLTVVGPEAPLVMGIVDQFRAEGLSILGPTAAAAKLEGSKSFAKSFMERYNIPTAAGCAFEDADQAVQYINNINFPAVIKANGLAAGKGVIIAETKAEAITAVDKILREKRYGSAGNRIVIEEFLTGEEASFIVIVDGDTMLPLASSQDHKALLEGDKGPNTGGMGAYSPAPIITAELYQQIIKTVIFPTIAGMRAEGEPYTGFLYAGLMICEDQSVKVLEYNCRMGDPETQPIMMRLQSDLFSLCMATIQGKLHEYQVAWNPYTALGVVMAAGGYPEIYRKGDIIKGLDKAAAIQQSKVFHAGTQYNDNHQIVTSGGRVLCATALGENITDAQSNAYRLVDQIDWKDVCYRQDIGHKATHHRHNGKVEYITDSE